MSKKIFTNRLFLSLLILANLLFYFRVADTVSAQAVNQPGSANVGMVTQEVDGVTLDPVIDPVVPQTLTNGDVHLPPEIPASTTSDGPDKNSESSNLIYENIDRSSFKGSRTFIISAYYSPLPGQNKYVTGSYSGDVRLNGGGVHGADGSNVYPGMIAAPKGYPFGTKMKIPDVGLVAVHDRGGAIVHSGQRGNSFDRLDVWMGYGDAGLKRALNWGRRTLDVVVYGIDDSLKEEIVLAGYRDDEKYVAANADTNIDLNEQTLITNQSLTVGSQGEAVSKIQKILQDLNYYSGSISSVFDEATLNAVTKFQIDHKIIHDSTDFGAGVVGPKTTKVLAGKMNEDTGSSREENVYQTDNFKVDLKTGDSGNEVIKLQEELKRINLLGIDSTGMYGDVTAHAVFKFQQSKGLAGDENSQGAGVFGPKTRAALSAIVNQRLQTEKLIANRKPEE